MSMAIPITIPRLGWDMVEGVFVGWLKADGDPVHAGEALFTLESDKSTEDIECFDDGVLRIVADGPRKGDKVAVGTVIGYLAKEGESVPIAGNEPPASSFSVRDIPQERNALAGAAPGPARQAGPTVSPRAKRIAAELGVDWTQLQGTGRTGRIRESDVRAAQATTPPATLAASSMRKTIAERMLHSHRSTAPVTLTTTADATNLVNLRGQAKAAAAAGNDFVPSVTDLIVKLTAIALGNHHLINASWVDDEIVVSQGIHIGIAVEMDEGLLVPVVRDVPSLTLRELSARSKDLIDRARHRKLKADEMRGGTFTVTNLGALGIDAFTPIIHYPQCAILGVGRIQRRPVVIGEQIVAREQITLSLTFDHRLVDGAPAARFLQMVSALIENPAAWLMT